MCSELIDVYSRVLQIRVLEQVGHDGVSDGSEIVKLGGPVGGGGVQRQHRVQRRVRAPRTPRPST